MEEEDIPPLLLQLTESRRLRHLAVSILLYSGVILLLLLAAAFAFGFKAIWDSLNPVSFLLAVVCLFLGQNHGADPKNESPKSTTSTPMHRWCQETVDGVFYRLLSSDSYRNLRRESLNLSDDEPPPHHLTDSDFDSDQFYDAISDDEHRQPSGAGYNSNRVRARSEPPQEVESYDERRQFRDDISLNGYRTNSNRRFFDDTDFSGYRVNSNSDNGRDVLSPATALEQKQNVETKHRIGSNFHPPVKQREVKDNNEGSQFCDDSDFSGHRVNANSDHGGDVLSPATSVEQQQNVETSDDHRHRIGSNFHQPVKQREVKDNNELWRFYDDIYLYGRNKDEHWRFYDDTHLHGYRSGSDSGQMQVHPPFPEGFQKPIPSAPPLPESPPFPWPESPTEAAGGQENFSAPPISPPSAQPQPPTFSRKSLKRRTIDLWASFGKKNKKKKRIQRQNNVENLASLFDPQSSFHQSSNPPPSATPDPPPSRSDGASTSREPRTTVEAKPPKPARSTSEPPKPARLTNKPPKPARSTAFSAAETNVESEDSSSLSSMPPSPPAPSFGVIPWRFEWHGDFVRAASFTESMCGSSDLDGAEPPGKEAAAIAAGGSGASTSAPSSCSSPDVNVKAGKFIANFRADLMTQEMNSKKARLNSRAGPDLGRKGPT